MSRLVRSAAALLVACVPSQGAAPFEGSCATGVAYAGVQLQQLCLDVPYGPHPCQRIDAYLVEAPAPAPVLIELHGGAFRAGAKSRFEAYLDAGDGSGGVIELALRHGISVVSVGYRLSSVTDEDCRPILAGGQPLREPAHAFPAPHDDAAAALAFVRARALAGDWNIDPARIAVIGGSAGGTLALGLALRAPDSSFAARAPTEHRPLAQALAVRRGLRGVLALVAPTDFRPFAFDLCPGREADAWHFGAGDLLAFRHDRAVLARRAAASPLAWIAEHGAPRETRFLGLYAGQPGWTAADLHAGGAPCSGYLDPLALPTDDPHAASFGLLLEDALLAAGTHWARTMLVDPDACDTLAVGAAIGAADFLAGALDRRPGHSVGVGAHTDPAGGSAPELSVFGRFEAGTLVTLWVRGAPAGATARLLLAPQAVYEDHPGGLLVPGGRGLVIEELPAADGCGFLHVVLDAGLLAGGPLFAQVELTRPGPAGQQLLTDAWWLE